MSQFALRFEKNGFGTPAFSMIPADSTPAEELGCFLAELDKHAVDHRETSPGVHEVTFLAGQTWRVQVVRVGDLEDTQTIEKAG